MQESAYGCVKYFVTFMLIYFQTRFKLKKYNHDSWVLLQENVNMFYMTCMIKNFYKYANSFIY